ncbi:MAG: response regulator [Dehalococcoidales bacterium]|nr:response regulator [Dehalococcoidales bacterium]
MLKPGEFSQHVQTALAHLYDYPYLEKHALARLLAAPTSRLEVARSLQSLLVQQIEALKPPDDLPRDSLPWLSHRYLLLRYLQQKNAVQVAQELAISERQSRRVRAAAMAALVAALWPMMDNVQGASTAKVQPDPGTGTAAPPKNYSTPDSEVIQLTAMSGQRSVGLAEVLDGVVSTIENLASASGVAIRVDLPPDSLPVAFERTLLRQVLLSLLAACVSVGARSVTAVGGLAGSTVELKLLVSSQRDNGLRRRAKQESDTGDLAERLHDNRSLKIGAHLLETQGCVLRVWGEQAGAAVIEVTLPLGEGRAVLIVDDNPDTIRLFRLYLCEGAYRVIEASDGPSAVRLARQLRPAVIILDVMMPNQDGWETLQTLSNHPDTMHIPVMICSVIDQRDLALSLGAVDLVKKPIGQVALLEALERCLAKSAKRSG